MFLSLCVKSAWNEHAEWTKASVQKTSESPGNNKSVFMYLINLVLHKSGFHSCFLIISCADFKLRQEKKSNTFVVK